uniref:Uncharacterized protein n=1 Tax=Palpitomonas bilix TaxID=652834 RepID=A0A7S3DAW2_9EUKA|mmetsp:Transcript_29795/g.76929  ORF Transcript_29795/g.76929 Transcript_29795/m.76929 type:complete len:473 (+) Transcript_29795:63-1481(+)
MVATSAIRVPTQDGEGVVEIQPESLPEEVEEMTDLLEKEVAPLSVWLQVGLAYYAKGDRDSFEKLMHMCTNDSVLDNYYQSDAQGQAEVLSSFASFKLEEAKRMAEENNSDARRKRDDLIVEASSLYSKAATVSNNASVMEVHSGFLEILGRKDTKSVQRAENMFKKALASESENIIAQIGLANLLLRKADKEKGTQSLEESLTYYKKVLRSCPTVPADVRLCIALIFQRLNFVDKARDAFERVLELDNENVTARVGLALLDLNNRENLHYDEKEIVQRAMKLLEEAFFIDPFHPMVLVHLANHYFISGTDNGREKSLLFAIRAFNSAKSNRVKAEARFMSGRALYYSGDVQTASDHFEEALSLWKEFPLALLGHGQCMISTGDLKSAESIFDSLHQLVPGSIFVIKCLGSLQSATGNRASAIKMLKRATELDDSDPYSLMLLGEQLQTETAEPKLLETKKLFEKSVAAFKS